MMRDKEVSQPHCILFLYTLNIVTGKKCPQNIIDLDAISIATACSENLTKWPPHYSMSTLSGFLIATGFCSAIFGINSQWFDTNYRFSSNCRFSSIFIKLWDFHQFSSNYEIFINLHQSHTCYTFPEKKKGKRKSILILLHTSHEICEHNNEQISESTFFEFTDYLIQMTDDIHRVEMCINILSLEGNCSKLNER